MDSCFYRPGFFLMVCRVLIARLKSAAKSLVAGLLFVQSAVGDADSVVVFNEIMYHPSTQEAQLEWVELYNQMAVRVDMSGWSIAGGTRFQFPEGTVIPGGGYLVVASDAVVLHSANGQTNVIGPLAGRLSNGGDQLELRNKNDRIMDRITYGVDGDWPVAPDGSGVSLAKKEENLASRTPKSWCASALVGGTPGRRNFATKPFEVSNSVPIIASSLWRYNTSDPGAAWRQKDFDDRSWAEGQGYLGASTASLPEGDPEPVPSAFSTGQSESGRVFSPGSKDPHYWLTASAQSTPPPPAIAATVIQNHPAWAANDAASSWIGPVNPGTENVAAGTYNYRTTFNLEGYNPATAKLILGVGADNRLTSVLLNGIDKGISYTGFSTLSGDFVMNSGFLSRTNTIDFLTVNDGDGVNPGGFRANLHVTARKALELRTRLTAGATTYYFRNRFVVEGAPAMSSLRLNAIMADGAVFYLNGAEVLRLNLPPGPISSSTLALSNIVNPTELGPFLLPQTSLLTGTNVLAVEVHRGPAGGSNLVFGAELQTATTNILIPPAITLAFNEISCATNNGFWVELINYGTTDVDLGDCALVRQGGQTNPVCTLAPATLAPGETLLLSDTMLGYGAEAGDRLFLYASGQQSVLDAAVVGAETRARWPDGTGSWWFPTRATPNKTNYFEFQRDVVINEVFYHPPAASATAAVASTNESAETWFELYNRGAKAVDLTGWRVIKDVEYVFPAGTTVLADGYLVVAKDPARMRASHPGASIVGPFAGNLGRSSGELLLLDEAGNPADEVHYFDGKPWPDYPDGGGSSLELRNPWADNSIAESWAASREASRSSWSNYTYRGIATAALGPTIWNEFVLGLLDAGECLIDDLKVVENPTTTPVQMLQNGTFESGFTAWRALGDHGRSRVEVDPDNPANHVLHLIATGPTDHQHNHLETTLANKRAVVNGREYQISFRAKWLAGNPRLNTRLYFNRLAKTTVLAIPTVQGTPGTPNSTWMANLGPTFKDLSHSPVVPKPNEPVTVRIRASDPHGVGAAHTWWSANGGAWSQIPMQLEGGRSWSGYSNYVAVLPGKPEGTVVQFFVQAADRLGVVATFPAGGTNSRALYKVDAGANLMTALHSLRLIMKVADADLLHAPTNVMSNERIGLTLVYDEQEVFYDIGVHLQSSERGRNDSSRAGFTLQLHPDHLFRGVQDNITIDRSGGYSGRGGRHDEILLWHAVNHAGGIPGFHCDLVQCFAPRALESGTGMLRMSAFDKQYFDSQFERGGDGNTYKLELIYYPTTTLNGDAQAPKLPQPDDVINVDIQNWGNEKENYRWIFRQENNADLDSYEQIVALNKAFSLTGASLETQTSRLMDLDEWMRVLAFKAFTGDVDTYTYGLNHNWKIYIRPEDGKALGLLWDMDFSFVQSVDYAPLGSGSPNTYRIGRIPDNYRRFWNHLLDLSTTTVNQKYLQPWSEHYAGLVGQDWSGALSYLVQRAAHLRSGMPLKTPFAITTHGGTDFGTATNRTTLTGTAPLTVKDITVNGVFFPITWTSLTNWTLTVPLTTPINRLTIQARDSQGGLLTNALDSITITNTSAPALLNLVINEWMADNQGPGGFMDPFTEQFSDWFELYNPNSVSLDLTGYSLTDRLELPAAWIMPSNTIIGPKGFLVVRADNAPAVPRPGSLYSGFQLSKSGDTIALYSPNGSPQHLVVFGSQHPNTSQGLFPDGDTNRFVSMNQWTPGSPNLQAPPPPPRIQSIERGPNRSISLRLTALPERTYSIQYQDSLNQGFWVTLDTRRAAGTELVATDLDPGSSARYYRVILLE